MLTIKNIHKLENRTLNKRNFYVSATDYSINQNNEHNYLIIISNGTNTTNMINKIIKLNREPITEVPTMKPMYKMTCEYKGGTTNHYIEFEAIKNIDKFINAVRLVGLSLQT